MLSAVLPTKRTILCSKNVSFRYKKVRTVCISVHSGLDSHRLQYMQKVHTHSANIRYIEEVYYNCPRLNVSLIKQMLIYICYCVVIYAGVLVSFLFVLWICYLFICNLSSKVYCNYWCNNYCNNYCNLFISVQYYLFYKPYSFPVISITYNHILLLKILHIRINHPFTNTRGFR